MATNGVLKDFVHHTQEELSARMSTAREHCVEPEGARAESDAGQHRGSASVDGFVAAASRHLHAVNQVLLPPARRDLPEGKELAHDYLASVHELEVMLAHVKAHEFGSVYESHTSWHEVWLEVAAALARQRNEEQALVDRLTESLDDERLTELTERMEKVQPDGPTRPHPYVPQVGVTGRISRKVMGLADKFWDTAENRMVPEKERPPRKRPGLLGQYLLGNPRMEDREP